MAIKYTKHAKEMLALRGISKKLADQTVKSPDEVFPSRVEKKIYLKD
ncbi:hypothetical protein HYW41_05325 [Candidatus Daviesbacteria bacterium]|nr:hypothetical protein [Candidatus Daviesbacteria bacterium]